jgi:hypothetical protein
MPFYRHLGQVFCAVFKFSGQQYFEKYPQQQALISIPRALIYFEDAEKSENPRCLKQQAWDDVKQAIREKIKEFLLS